MAALRVCVLLAVAVVLAVANAAPAQLSPALEAAAAAGALPKLPIDPAGVTVGGISAGAYMAVQRECHSCHWA